MQLIFEKLKNLNVSEGTLISILETISNNIHSQAAQNSLDSRKEQLQRATKNFADILGKLSKNNPKFKEADKKLKVAQDRVEHATNVSNLEPKKQGYIFTPSAFK